MGTEVETGMVLVPDNAVEGADMAVDMAEGGFNTYSNETKRRQALCFFFISTATQPRSPD